METVDASLTIDLILLYWVFQEKAPYEAKAAKRKSDYEKLMAAYNKKQVIIGNPSFANIFENNSLIGLRNKILFGKSSVKTSHLCFMPVLCINASFDYDVKNFEVFSIFSIFSQNNLHKNIR